jgi:hypothetical protein
MAAGKQIVLSSELEAKIAGLWSSQQDRARVREALAGEVTWSHGSERVPFAILKLCNGEVEKVLSMVAEARLDFRDILTAAEYPGQGDALLASMSPGATDADRARFEAAATRDREQYEEWLKK